MRRTLCWVNATDASCGARARCEPVCAFTPSDRKIGHTVRSTCVYVRKLREGTNPYALYRGLPRMIARSSCWILRSRAQRIWSYVLQKNILLVRKFYACTVLLCTCFTRRTDHDLDHLDPIAAPMRYCAKYLDLIDHTRETCVEDPDIIDPTRTNMC